MKNEDRKSLSEVLSGVCQKKYSDKEKKEAYNKYRKLASEQAGLTRYINKQLKVKDLYFDLTPEETKELFDAISKRKEVTREKDEKRAVAKGIVKIEHSFGKFELKQKRLEKLKNPEIYVEKRIERDASRIIRDAFNDVEDKIVFEEITRNEIIQLSGLVMKFKSVTSNEYYLNKIKEYEKTLKDAARKNSKETIKIVSKVFSSKGEYIALMSKKNNFVDITFVS